MEAVCLRAEAISKKETQVITISQSVGEGVAITLMLAEVILKYAKSDSWYLHTSAQSWLNVGVLGFCLLPLLSCQAVFTSRVIRHWSSIWGRWRRVTVLMAGLEGLLVILSLVAMFVTNAYVLTRVCSWFDMVVITCAFLAWTCWNTLFMLFLLEARGFGSWSYGENEENLSGRGRSLLEVPFAKHTWVLLNWLAFEFIGAALMAVGSINYRKNAFGLGDCTSLETAACKLPKAEVVLVLLLLASWAVWIVLWLISIYRVLRSLQRRSWHKNKLANIVVRVQVRSRLICIVMFALSVALLMLLDIDSCASNIQTWHGLTPMAVIFTIMSMSVLFFCMPTSRTIVQPVIQGMLQQFSWTEEEKAALLEKRNRRFLDFKQAHVCAEPMFCFETVVKLFYFSALLYDYKEEAAAEIGDRQPQEASVKGYSLPKAMELYNLEQFELLYEPAEDTKVLLAWNKDTVILAFRGTASLINVKADIQVWLSAHHSVTDPKQDCSKIHSGFLRSWIANGLHKRVLKTLQHIFATPGVDLEHMQILLTGHSLGGALATLAAYDIALDFVDLLRKDQVACYTVGAPRTGNHAFADCYDEVVPDTWHLINGRDIVARSGKFISSYKRPGQRVVTNQLGDMLVRPSFAELSAVKNMLPFQASVRDHFLVSYQASLISVCSAQFGDKASEGGIQGMKTLLSSGQVYDVLSEIMVTDKLANLATCGGLSLLELKTRFKGMLVKLQPLNREHGDSKEIATSRPAASEDQDEEAGNGRLETIASASSLDLRTSPNSENASGLLRGSDGIAREAGILERVGFSDAITPGVSHPEETGSADSSSPATPALGHRRGSGRPDIEAAGSIEAGSRQRSSLDPESASELSRRPQQMLRLSRRQQRRAATVETTALEAEGALPSTAGSKSEGKGETPLEGQKSDSREQAVTLQSMQDAPLNDRIERLIESGLLKEILKNSGPLKK